MQFDRKRWKVGFNRLYDAHYAAVRVYAWRRDPALADDVVSETFLVAWRRLEDIPRDSPLPWLLGVARNVRLNMQRSERRRVQRESLDAAEREVRGAADFSQPDTGDDRLWQLLRALPERDREVLLLVAWEGLERADIAAILGCSQASVALRLFRARRRLRAALDGDKLASATAQARSFESVPCHQLQGAPHE